MRTGSVLFLLGVCCLARLSGLPSPWLLLAFPSALALALRWPRLRRPCWWLGGFLWALLRADLALSHRIARPLEGRVLHAVGSIDSLPDANGEAARFDFRIEELREPGGGPVAAPAKVRLSWYRPAGDLVPGDRWAMTVKLRRPAGFMNPGGFDYEGWLLQQGIGATGYVIDFGTSALPGRGPVWDVDRWRYRVRERLNAMAGSEPLGALLPALAVGDTGGMTRAQWRVLNRSGTTHLLAISGLHIAFFAGLCFVFVRRAWPLSAAACRRLAAPRAAAMAAIIGAVVYSALAGFSVPTQRSVVMIAVWMSQQALYRHTGMSHVLGLALVAVLLYDPFSVLAPGFWLSFGAVAVIAWALGNRAGRTGWWWRWGQVQVAVSIGLLPLLALWFRQVPLLGMLANLAAVPWVTFLCVPLILAGTAMLPFAIHAAELLLRLALWSLSLLWPLLQIAGAGRSSVWTVAAPALPAVLMAVAGAALLLLPRGVPRRWLGAFWMLPLLFPPDSAPEPGRFALTLLDVGQGLSAVIRTHAHVLAYDTGPRFGADFNAGGAVVAPYLRYFGIRSIDTLVLSHGDSDHIGGLDDVLDAFEVGRILAGAPGAVSALDVRPCVAGEAWEWDGVRFEVLHPSPDFAPAGNNRSCVLRVGTASLSALLTGDIEAEAERSLVTNAGARLRSTVLVAPHHGSRTSSTAAFVDAVRPEVVLFAAGYRNRFGFPNQDIIRRYQRHGAKVLDTGRSGAVTVQPDGAGIVIRSWRREHLRFWHSRLD